MGNGLETTYLLTRRFSIFCRTGWFSSTSGTRGSGVHSSISSSFSWKLTKKAFTYRQHNLSSHQDALKSLQHPFYSQTLSKER